MENKKCCRCGEVKETSCFAKKIANKDGLYLWCRSCCAAHKATKKIQIADSKRKWAADNRDKLRQACAKWFSKNKQKKLDYSKSVYKNDLNRRISCILRSRLSHAVKNNQKAGSAIRDLGSSIEEFKIYLESKFQPDMTWGNYGHKTWHIDHIVPLSSFNLSDPVELKQACHYTNLQPLWAVDNLIKSNKTL